MPGVKNDVSRLVLGTMIVNLDERDSSFKLLDDAVSLGYSTLDTAHIYAGGDSERAIGEWMKERGNRDDIVIISKCSHPNQDRKRVTPYDIGADLLDTLARLKTDYVDIYMLHRDDTDVPVSEIVDAMNKHVKAGRIRAFGGSNWTHQRLAEANAYAAENGLVPFSCSSPNFSLASQVADPWGDNSGSVTLSGPKNTDARAWYADQQMPVFAWSSLARGFFSGRLTRENYRDVADGACARAYCHEENFTRLDRVRELAEQKSMSVPQIALAYVMSQPMKVFALIGAQNRSEMQANLDAANLKLTESEMAYLNLEA